MGYELANLFKLLFLWYNRDKFLATNYIKRIQQILKRHGLHLDDYQVVEIIYNRDLLVKLFEMTDDEIVEVLKGDNA